MNIQHLKGRLAVVFVSILSILMLANPNLYFFAQNAITSQLKSEPIPVAQVNSSETVLEEVVENATPEKQNTTPIVSPANNNLNFVKPNSLFENNTLQANSLPITTSKQAILYTSAAIPVKKLPIETNSHINTGNPTVTNPIIVPNPVTPTPTVPVPDPTPIPTPAALTKIQREGKWSDPFRSNVVGIQASTLPNGKILLFDGSEGAGTGDSKNLLYEIYDTATKTTQLNTAKSSFGDIIKYSAFCAAMTILPSGNIFFAGGDVVGDAVGTKKSGLFDSLTNTMSSLSQMTFARWYPSAIQTLTGEILVVGGTQSSYQTPATTPEVYDLNSNTWKALPGADDKNDSAYGGTGHFYPWLYNLSNGKVANLGPRPTISLIDTANSGNIQNYGARDIYDGDNAITARLQNYGSVARYGINNVLVTGGGSDPDAHNPDLIEPDSHDTFDTKPTETANILDLNQLVKNPTGNIDYIRETGRPVAPRTNSTLAILADGTVMLTGGTSMNESANRNAHYDTAIQTPELWNKATESWSSLAAHKTKRIYHSIALLQKDGTVLQGGGSGFNGQCSAARGNNAITVKGQNACHELDIYEPGYLFDANGNYKDRPAITSSKPTNISPGSTFNITSNKNISKVTLVRPGSTTHSTNIQQYFMDTTVKTDGTKATITLPNSYFAAPKGFYMMFAWDQNGTPSIAQEVEVL
jgi:galactose oxidase